MKMNRITSKMFEDNFSAKYYKRIGENRKLKLYIGKNEKGQYSFEFCGNFSPKRIPSSDVIRIEQFQKENDFVFRISLENNNLIECFCTFCQDLLDSTVAVVDDNTAYKSLCSRYFSWRQLFKSNKGCMSESEIMGLIGELLFLQNYLFHYKDIDTSLDSWCGPEKAHKDFSFNNEWYEVKTISFGKESIKISSIEQLDSEIEGRLCVFTLERMSPSFNGISLKKLVVDIIGLLETVLQKELFLEKLKLYNFDFSQDYEKYVYSLKDMSLYLVKNSDFPLISRKILPNAVSRVSYEIQLTEIVQYKES